MRILFYNELEGTLPASPGAPSSIINLSTPAGYGDTFGILEPLILLPSAAPGVIGCDAQSSAKIVSYKYDFEGAAGLRPGNGIDNFGLNITFPGRNNGSSAIANLAWINDDWQESNIFFKRIPFFVNGEKCPVFLNGAKTISIDSRYLLPDYYGATFNLRLILAVECVGVGL